MAADGHKQVAAGRPVSFITREEEEEMRILGALGSRAVVHALLGLAAVAASFAPVGAQAQQYSVWVVESSRFMGVPYGAFMPDRTFVPGSTSKFNNINTVDLPVNVTVIKGTVNGKLEVVLYDTGWKQQDYLKMTGSDHWRALPETLKALGISADQVTKLVVGHAHWDHAGSLSDFPNAKLYVQRKELEGIEWALNYPHPRIAAHNLSPGGCFRTPACGYPPKTLDEIYGKVLSGMAVVVDGQMEILPGIIIHPAFHAHTPGSQLLEIRTGTSVGTLVAGSDVYSSWQGIRDWMVANIQSSTDSAQQFLAYEKCYKLTGRNDPNNCISGHEPTSYTKDYPLLSNAFVAGNGARVAEVALASGESSRKK
jgi:glyoxylase-like metal-dependent hydrolase (beta-lactamase superfamily II)